jgi:hypothetical protein
MVGFLVRIAMGDYVFNFNIDFSISRKYIYLYAASVYKFSSSTELAPV